MENMEKYTISVLDVNTHLQVEGNRPQTNASIQQCCEYMLNLGLAMAVLLLRALLAKGYGCTAIALSETQSIVITKTRN